MAFAPDGPGMASAALVRHDRLPFRSQHYAGLSTVTQLDYLASLRLLAGPAALFEEWLQLRQLPSGESIYATAKHWEHSQVERVWTGL